MKKGSGFLLVALGLMLAAGPGADAVSRNPQCVQDARDDFGDCVSNCRETFRLQKDSCRSVDHECAETCRGAFESCLEAPMTELIDCKTDCGTELAAARANCRALYAGNPVGLDRCIDQAQGVAFSCRDQCRENVQADLALCRQNFVTCLRACPAPNP